LKAPSLKKQPDYDAQGFINARLMAAAPCMYDALVATLKLLQDPEGDEYQANTLESRISDILATLEQPL
jgi:hypothetical protein